MSMPGFPKCNCDLTQDQALTMLLSSIALEETALSHIINAESEKIQYILSQHRCSSCNMGLTDILAVNNSVTGVLEAVLQNQMILKSKLERVLEHLPKPTCLHTPPPPIVALRQIPTRCCCQMNRNICFGVVARTYYARQPLQWMVTHVCEHFKLAPEDCSKIQLPHTGTIALDLYLDIANSPCSNSEMILTILCQSKQLIVKPMQLDQNSQRPVCHHRTVVQIPCSCCQCCASVTLYTPDTVEVQHGTVLLTRL